MEIKVAESEDILKYRFQTSLNDAYKVIEQK